MRSFCLFCLVVGIVGQASYQALSAEFRLSDGTVVRGEVASFDDNGLVVRLDIGGFSPRVNWSKLTQETLKDLAKNPEAAKFVDPFIETPPEPEKEKKKKKEIVIKPVPRTERPEKTNLIAIVTAPAGLAILAILFLANLYAGYEIALFRNRPIVLVCGVSAIFPVVGPLLFLSMPPRDEYAEGESGTQEPHETGHASAAAAPGGPAGARASATTSAVKAKPAGSLAVAPIDTGGASTPVAEPAIFKRGDFTFNRRFFETKFPGFFRVVPSETEKDLVIVIKAAKAEHVAKRISRITMNELHVQLLRGGTEAAVSFTEIIEVQVRHKDGKG